MPIRKPSADRFKRIAQAQRVGENTNLATPQPTTVIIGQNRRLPNVDYEREGKLFAKVPKALHRRLKAAALRESTRAAPEFVDMSQIVEAAVREWLDKNGHPAGLNE